MNRHFVNAISWVATACVVGVAIIYTKNLWSILGLLIPTVANMYYEEENKDESSIQ